MFDNSKSAYSTLVGETGATSLLLGRDIRNQRMPFTFEIQDQHGKRLGERDNVFILPINPEHYSVEESPRSTVTQTIGGAFVDTIGNGLRHITMSGTFGYLGTFNPESFRIQGRIQGDAWTLFKNMEDTFTSFYRKYGTTTAQGTPISDPWPAGTNARLCFYNYTDKLYAVVNIDRFRLQRSIQRRFLYQYDLQMTIIQELAPDKRVDTIEEQFSKPWVPNAGALSPIALIYGIGTGLLNLVNAVISDIHTLSQQVTAFINGTAAFIAAPYAVIGSIHDNIQGIIDAFNNLTNVPEQQADMAVCTLRETQLQVLSLRAFKDSFQPGTTTGTVSQTTNAKQEPVRANDTIEDIAIRAAGSADKWTEVATLNDLEYPYVVSDVQSAFTGQIQSGLLVFAISATDTSMIVSGSMIGVRPGTAILLTHENQWATGTVSSIGSGTITIDSAIGTAMPAGASVGIYDRMLRVLTPGAQAKIPSDVSSVSAISGGGAPGTAARIFGTDESVNEDGDHSSSTTGVPDTLTGYDNLLAALQHRLNTPRGELSSLGHPEYGSGLPVVIGQISTDYWYERAILEAKIAMLQDPRIAAINNMRFTVNNTEIYLDCEVVPVNSAPTTMSILVGG